MAVIGWILLTILGLLLFLILLILFFPISYRIEGLSQKEIPINLSARVFWLFGFIRVMFDYPKPSRPIVKLAFFTIFGKEKKNKKNEREQSIGEEQENTSESSVDDNQPAITEAKTDQDQSAEQEAKEDSGEKLDAQKKTAKTPDEANKKENLQKKNQKFSERFKKIKTRISKEYLFYKKLWLDEDTKPFVKDTLSRVFHILRNVLPKRISGRLRFGAASPDITGYVFGIYCIISSFFNPKYSFTLEPEFENQIIEGELLIKGRFCTFTLLWDGLRIFFDRRLKKIRKRIEKHQEKMSQLK